MNLQKIETEDLHLSKEDRAQLIQKLVLSLDSPTPEVLRPDWLAEAQRRTHELDEGPVLPVPGDDVMRKARALLK
jgi:putative addiction module component (TIGR02574 family)